MYEWIAERAQHAIYCIYIFVLHIITKLFSLLSLEEKGKGNKFVKRTNTLAYADIQFSAQALCTVLLLSHYLFIRQPSKYRLYSLAKSLIGLLFVVISLHLCKHFGISDKLRYLKNAMSVVRENTLSISTNNRQDELTQCKSLIALER